MVISFSLRFVRVPYCRVYRHASLTPKTRRLDRCSRGCGEETPLSGQISCVPRVRRDSPYHAGVKAINRQQKVLTVTGGD